MRSRILQVNRRIFVAAIFMLAATLICPAQTNKENLSIGTVKNFSAPGEYFAPPFHHQMKSLIQGAEAQPLPNRQFRLVELKLTMFQTNGEPEMIVEAPECVYDEKTHMADSAGSLSVRVPDGAFSLEGKGFQWQERASALYISNQVHSILHKASPDTNAPGTLQPGEKIEIFSAHFARDFATGQSSYRDNVRVISTNVTLAGDELALTLPMTNDVIRLTGHATWTSDARNGGGDELEIDRAHESLRAAGNSFVKMPGTAIGTNAQANANGATEKSFEVQAEKYLLRTNEADFNGNVQVTQFSGTQRTGNMTCSAMTVAMGSASEIESILAQTNVVVEQDDGRFTGDTARFFATNATAEFSGKPTWSKGNRSGSGDLLFVDQTRGQMTAQGNARMKLPGSAMNTNAANDKFTLISSDDYTVKVGRAEFTGHVRIEDPQMNITSDRLIAESPSNSDNIERILAEQNVQADLTDSNGQTTHVSGQRAFYTMSDSLLRLTGTPVVQNERGWLTGSIIVWDRAYDLMIVRNQRMVFQAENTTTNGLPNLLNGN